MKAKIEIVPSKSNRYEERQFSNSPIIKSKFRLFMLEIDKFISHLNKLISNNKELYVLAYNELCMIINSSLIGFDSKPQIINDLKEEVELSYLYVYDNYKSKQNDISLKDLDDLGLIYSSLDNIINLMKSIYNENKSSVDKLRGIIMEAVCVSIFGTDKEFKDNNFVWDFNAYEDDELIVVNKRQTADIYYKEAMKCYISEVKCRPAGINEEQVDFINYVAKKIDENNLYTPKKIILHGGTIDDFNNLNIGFKDKLDDYKIYCINSIEKLLQELPI